MQPWARVVVAVAAGRVAIALALYLSGQVIYRTPRPLPLVVYALLSAAFVLLGLTLVLANRHDVRATWLGGVFVLTALPLSSPLLAASSFSLLLAVRADAFLPAFLWRFTGAFPSPLAGRTARVVRAVSNASAVIGLALAVVNLSFVASPVSGPADWRLALQPGARPGSLYYPLVFGLSVLAFPALLWRVWTAEAAERHRALIFAGALIGGSLPLVLQVILEAIPGYYAFVHGQPAVELLVGFVVFGALATIPFVTAYSVLFDRVVELRVVLRAALQYALARYTILFAALVPLGAFALILFRHRAEPMTTLLVGPRPVILGVMAVVALAALRGRQTWLDALDRRFFREDYDARQLLNRLVTDALHVTTPADLERRVGAAIDHALHADTSLFVADESLQLLRRPDGGSDPISTSGVLVTLAAADEEPMDVDLNDSRSPLRRLPRDEQSWLVNAQYRLLLPLRTPDKRPAGLLALSAKRSGLPYSDGDRRMLSAVAASVSLTLHNLRLRASTPHPSSEVPAQECHTCHSLHPPDASTCTCGGTLFAASVPYLLRGTFQLDRRIGTGGMGVVYHARDLHLDRSVAIKTLPRVAPDWTARLRREGRAMAAVTHPNLATVHGIETWQNVPLLIEEYLGGGTLADRLAAGPLTVADTLDLGVTLAGALEGLHQAGVIHRDVKPSNIGFTDSGVVKLLDFGLARLASGVIAAAADATITVWHGGADSGTAPGLVGTPPYMAPEALIGRNPDPTFDIWSLSVVLYEAMTGRRPFQGADALETMASVTAGLRVAPGALVEGCPAPIDEYFLRALGRDPSQRPPDARTIRADLLRLRALAAMH